MGLNVMDTKSDVPMPLAQNSAQSPLPLSSLQDFHSALLAWDLLLRFTLSSQGTALKCSLAMSLL